jgi:hypothetical protein
MVICCHSTVITEEMWFYNTEMMVLPWNGNKLPGKKFYTIGPTEQTLMLKLRTMTKDFFELLQKSAIATDKIQI